MSNASVIWLLDDREIRRAAVSGFLSIWARQALIDIRAVDAVEAIPRRRADGDETPPELCVLVVGGTSLADPELSSRVESLVETLAGRPLAILSDIDAPLEVTLAIELGVNGLITTNMATSVAVAALNFILLGGTYFERSSLFGMYEKLTNGGVNADASAESLSTIYDSSARQRVKAALHDGQPAVHMGSTVGTMTEGLGFQPTLTNRQKEIVEMLKLGRSNKEIARTLYISDATVKIFVRQVMKKYGAVNRTQVALLASDAMSQVDIIKFRPMPATPPARPEP